MSKFNLLSAAVVVALAATAPAYAYTVKSAATTPAPGTPVTVATVDIEDATTAVTATGINVNLSGSDLIIGRTVGFTVKISLKDGAKLAAAAPATPAIGAAVDSATASEDWSIAVAAGGAVGDDYVIYKFNPGADPFGVKSGDLFAAAMSLTVKGVAALANAGSTVSAEVMFADPGTAAQIMPPSVSAVILRSADPLKFAITGGETTKKIDVGSGNGNSKTTFSINGDINTSAAAGNTAQFFNAGVPSAGVQTGVLDAAGGGFAWVAADTVDLTLSGSFAAFKTTSPANGASVYLVAAGKTCNATPVAADILKAGTVSNTAVTFKGVSATAFNTNLGICFVAPAVASKVVIDATTIQASAVVTRDSTEADNSGSAVAKPMVYNGPVIEVDAFNPASNTAQLSYLRISNTSGLAGKASISRVCDDGTTKGSTSLSIAAGATVALTAEQLENGGNGIATGFGACPAGQKARLTVTGEFNGMKVQNFLRNSSTIINTNVNNNN